ncbi:hypothetical protein SAMN02799620_05603 [Mycolicibacterium fluoranthenivorans]|jgi:hypothetical protein|uniref:Glycerol acyltransferase n=1 Tax=Mycolicibacterium fluoranthenivorans TaxID=258505 RepID=A0A1G4WYQ1_9MYCO|nr:hypothetical protein SAMN02799620_05603 [Mycolicibacterium fluoranthenivorans]
MTTTNTDVIMNQPRRFQALRGMVETVADGVAPLVDLYRPYVDGLQKLPADGRFLLVGNHTQFGAEGLLAPCSSVVRWANGCDPLPTGTSAARVVCPAISSPLPVPWSERRTRTAN